MTAVDQLLGSNFTSSNPTGNTLYAGCLAAVPAYELVIVAGGTNGNFSSPAVTDTNANTYAIVGVANVTGSNRAGALLAAVNPNNPLSTSSQIGVGPGTNASMLIAAASFSGLSGLAATHSYAVATNVGLASPATVTSSATVKAGDLAILVISDNAQAPATPTGWSKAYSFGVGGSQGEVGLFWKVPASDAVLSPSSTVSTGGTAPWGAVIAAFPTLGRAGLAMVV